MSNETVVLITGASSGVGQATARLLSQNGYKVFGTTRNSTSAKPIPAVDLLALDVRSDDSVLACVKTVTNQVDRLDVLVNNAAYELTGTTVTLLDWITGKVLLPPAMVPPGSISMSKENWVFSAWLETHEMSQCAAQ